MINLFSKSVTASILLLIGLITIAYSNTFEVPFIFDDTINILDNPSIRYIWPPWSAFYVTPGTGIAGRPIVNFTLALNYAISEERVWSYHAFNLTVHILAALTLLGIVQRTLRSKRLTEEYGYFASPLALGCAILWALHPLQTQAVTYTIQRCESLMGLFFLLTLYCAIRGWQSTKNTRLWHLCAILSFVLGIGTKEVIISVIPLILLYEWVFNSNNPWIACKRSYLLYSGLLLGLMEMVILLVGGGTASSGTGNHSLTYIQYWMTQTKVVLHYIYLTFWPFSLCFQYGPYFNVPGGYGHLILFILCIIVSVFLLQKRNPVGFLMAWFFLILAPTSLYPLPDVAFEHRMYLPSMALIIISVVSIYRIAFHAGEKFSSAGYDSRLLAKKIFGYTLLFLVLLMGIFTYFRNLDYETDISIWTDTVRKIPNNATAFFNLGVALLDAGKTQNAIANLEYAKNIIDTPMLNTHSQDNALSLLYNNMGVAYNQIGQWQTAEIYFRKSLKLKPENVKALSGLGIALSMQGKNEEALLYLRRAIVIKPDFADAHINLGVVLRSQKNFKEALEHYKLALKIKSNLGEALYGMGITLFQLGDYDNARTYFQEIITYQPDNKQAMDMIIKIDKEK